MRQSELAAVGSHEAPGAIMTEIERLERYMAAVLQAAVDHDGISAGTRRSILELLVSLRKDLESAKRKATT